MAGMKFWAPNREYRTTGLAQNRLCDAAAEGMRQAAAPVRPHDDHVGRLRLGRLKNRIDGEPSTYEGFGRYLRGGQRRHKSGEPFSDHCPHLIPLCDMQEREIQSIRDRLQYME
jgi:hypothetical protein